jgi:hypothetical protein
VNATSGPLGTHPSFNRFGVFTEAAWLSQASAATPAFPPMAAYYIDHAMVIDVDSRDQWLAYARSRNIQVSPGTATLTRDLLWLIIWARGSFR